MNIISQKKNLVIYRNDCNEEPFPQSLINLSNGSANFCEVFGIALQENGLDLLDREISITDGEPISSKLIKCSSRIGIQQGLEKNWRFFIKRNP